MGYIPGYSLSGSLGGVYTGFITSQDFRVVYPGYTLGRGNNEARLIGHLWEKEGITRRVLSAIFGREGDHDARLIGHLWEVEEHHEARLICRLWENMRDMRRIQASLAC